MSHVLRLLLACICACADSTGTHATGTDAATDEPGDAATDEPIDGAADQDDPDYSRVFPADRVQRLDLTIAAADHAAMLADLDAYVSELDARSASGPPPAAAFDACEGRSAGDACSYEDAATTTTGSCQPDMRDPEVHVCIAEMRDPIYVEATVRHEDETWTHVGLRFKGNSSLRYSFGDDVLKLPFRLHFDYYEDVFPEIRNQRFRGFRELSFAPGYRDDSYLHDALAAEIFAGLGVPVARTAFYEIHVDAGEGPVYWGLYTAVEDPSDAMMGRVYGDDSGNLYKPEGPCATLACFSQAAFEKKTNEADADWSDVQAVVDALLADRSDAARWRSGLEAVFDVEGFLAWLAPSTLIVNGDAYGQAPHNYYLYGVPADGGRLTWITWDHNMTLETYRQMGGLSIDLGEVTDDWPLIRYLMDDPVYADLYYTELEEALGGLAGADAFAARAAELHDLIEPHVAAELAPYTQLDSLDAFDGSVAALIAHMADRRALAEAALASR